MGYGRETLSHFFHAFNYRSIPLEHFQISIHPHID